MSIIQKINDLEILPNQNLDELMKYEVYKNSSIHTLFTLIENNRREENKEQYFELLSHKGIWANETQKEKIKIHFIEIFKKIKKHYSPDHTDMYIEEIIDNIFPAQASLIKQARLELKKDLLS